MVTPSVQQSTSATPKLLQNKSLMCKPIMMTKATSCNPIRITKATQTGISCGDAFVGILKKVSHIFALEFDGCINIDVNEYAEVD